MSETIIKDIIIEKKQFIAPGVCERNISFIDYKDEQQELYILEVNLSESDIKVKLGMPMDGTEFGLTTVMEQAISATKENEQVIGAINGDFYNMTNGVPIGLTIKEGVLLKVGSKNAIGFKADGKVVVGEPTFKDGQLTGDWLDVVDAIGGWQCLIKDGVKQEIENDAFCITPAPRTAVGVKTNGSLILVVIDGRQIGYSKGITIHELVNLMSELGAIDALNLDGGGSTTFITRDIGYDILSVKNQPCDGEERVVANSLLVISTHVLGNVSQLAVLPQHELILPSSTIQFKAIPLDEAYHPLKIESEILWRVEAPTMGFINEHGLFQSSGQEGIATIKAYYNDTIIGETAIEVREPETIEFVKKSLQVNKSSQTQIQVLATFHKRTITTQNSDFTFSVVGDIGTINQDGIFMASDATGHGEIVVSFGDCQSILKVTVGQMPIVLEDFENGIDQWETSHARANQTNIELVTIPEPVRFGNYALKLSYDFTHQSGTSGAYASTKNGILISGYPHKIGMWVYGDSSHYMLRSVIVDGSGNNIHLTLENDINWIGWKYVEAAIPDGLQEPLMLHLHQTIRVIALANQDKIASAIYIDHIRAVYGETTDDLVNPNVHSVYPPEDSVVTTRLVDIKAEVKDDDGEYATGIHFERTKFIVDGIDYSDHLINIKSKDLVQLLECDLCDGTHKVQIVIYDHFGNMTEKEWYFTVDTGEFQFSLQHQEEALIGNDLKLSLAINSPKHIQSASFTFRYEPSLFELIKVDVPHQLEHHLKSDHKLGEFTIAFYNLYKYPLSNILECLFSIPTTLNRKDIFKLEIREAHLTLRDGRKGHLSFKPIEIPIKAHFKIGVPKWVIGYDATLNVLDEQSQAVEGAFVKLLTPITMATVNEEIPVILDNQTLDTGDTIKSGQKVVIQGILEDYYHIQYGQKQGYLPHDVVDKIEIIEELGISNREGKLTIDNVTCASFELLKLQAIMNHRYSFETGTRVVSHVEQAKPNKILLAPTENPYNEQLITWLTDPKTEETQVEFGFKGATECQQANGESYIRVFPDGAVRVHKIKLTGLKEEKTYWYRVGEQTNWSDSYEFTMPEREGGFEFIVFGDSQALPNQSDKNGFGILRSLYNQALSEVPNPAFILHVGDLIDIGGLYNHWYHALTAIAGENGSYRDRFVVAPGNHEYMEVDDFMFYNDLFHPINNGPSESLAYSFDFQHVHFAVLDAIVQKEELQRQLEWLKVDMKASHASFKIVILHKPPYFLNLEGGNGLVAELVPPVMDELGIDFVFSGHDHNYLRTKPLTNRTANDDGTIYLLAGSTGPKFYKAFEDKSLSDVCYEGMQVYLMIKVSSETFTITVKNINGEVVDYYQKKVK